jgi:hypothetical protein
MFTTELLARQVFAEAKWTVFWIALILVCFGVLVGWSIFG